jgi:hypothetical protein
MEMAVEMADFRFGPKRMWPALYALVALLTLLFQVYVAVHARLRAQLCQSGSVGQHLASLLDCVSRWHRLNYLQSLRRLSASNRVFCRSVMILPSLRFTASS